MRSSWKAATLTAVVALLAVGCSSAGNASGNASGTPSSALGRTAKAGGTTEATGNPITIGNILPTNAPFYSTPDWVAGVKAAIATVNAGGGIGGRPLSLDYCNEDNNANDTVACGRSFASNKNMVATVDTETVTANAQLTQTLSAAGMANVGYFPLTTEEFEASNNFPFDGQVSWEYASVAGSAIKLYHTKKVAVVLPGNPTTLNTSIINGVKAAGGTIVTTITLPLTAISSYSSYAEQIIRSGADLAVTPITDTELLGLIPAVRQLGGANIRFAVNANTLSDAQFSQLGSGGDGTLIFAAAPWIHDLAAYPGISKFITSMQQEAARGDSAANLANARPSTLQVWLSVIALSETLKSMVAEHTKITRANVLAAFKKARNIDLLGMTSFSWSPSVKQTAIPENSNVSNTYGYLLEAKNGEQVLVQKDPINTIQYMK